MNTDSRKVVDSCWDLLWDEGVSNPIRAIEIFSLALLGLKIADSEALANILKWSPNKVAEKVNLDLGIDFTEASKQVADSTFQKILQIFVKSGIHSSQDATGDAMEFALSKLSTAGRFGQFRTPSHIAQFMIKCMPIKKGNVISDPSAGTGGFLVACASEFPNLNLKLVGDEIDQTMCSIANANLALHGHESSIRRRDALEVDDEDVDLVLANPPFAGRISSNSKVATLVQSNKTEVLFLDLITQRIKTDGWGAVIVPISILTNQDNGTVAVRKLLQSQGSIRAIIELPAGVFRPYTDVRTAIIFWQKKKTFKNIHMWKIESDGFSLDDKRRPIEFSDLDQLQNEVFSLLNDLPYNFTSIEVPTDIFVDGKTSMLPSRYIINEDKFAINADFETLINRAQIEVANIAKNLEMLK